MSGSLFIFRDMVEATPMTYGEFLEEVDQTGTDFPLDTPGYIIQIDDSKVGWVHAEEFKESHLEVGNLEGLEPYQQRLMAERVVVAHNYAQLQKSFSKTTFLALPFETRELLQAQSRAMARYLEILNKRVTAFLH